MDKYHIYEEIGKGEFSQVFKGREKKKIEYVAIKRIEKSVMQKVLLYFLSFQFIRMLCRLSVRFRLCISLTVPTF